MGRLDRLGGPRQEVPPSQSAPPASWDLEQHRLARPRRLPTDAEMAEAVRDAFLHAWNGYLRHAWGIDALLPLSRPGKLVRRLADHDAVGWLRHHAPHGTGRRGGEAKALILDGLSFDHDFPVQIFEVTIRILGGLLSAYQMDGDPRFLALAIDLADRMLPAFESPTGMPYVRVNLRPGRRSGR